MKVANYALLESDYEQFWKDVEIPFESKNPNIKNEWVNAPYGEIMSQVINMAGVGGDKVDCIFSEIDWIPGFEDASLANPIEDILPQSFINDLYLDVMRAFEIDTRAYKVPLYFSFSKNIWSIV